MPAVAGERHLHLLRMGQRQHRLQVGQGAAGVLLGREVSAAGLHESSVKVEGKGDTP